MTTYKFIPEGTTLEQYVELRQSIADGYRAQSATLLVQAQAIEVELDALKKKLVVA